ncbi:MAG: 4Fe-4S binding protein [Treponema sp.]|nr:4Fe-4S binding protein [Treponema sp.]
MAKKGTITIERELCKGCYLCVRSCPVKAIEPDRTSNASGVYPARAVHAETCIACGSCYAVCPDVCITVYEEAV